MNEPYQTETYKNYKIVWGYDEWGDSPLEMNEYISKLICWHPRYRLGDKHNYDSPRDLFVDLIERFVPDKTMYQFIQNHEESWTAKFVQYTPEERIEEEADTLGFIDISVNGEYEEGVDCNNFRDGVDYFGIDYFVRNYMSIEECIDQLEPYVLIQPVSIYDHSGVTMWIGGPSDPWDSGQVGYIYTTKEAMEKAGCDMKNWKCLANQYQSGEVSEYDNFLRGEIFFYQIFDENEEVVESCGGFFGTECIDSEREELHAIIDACIKRNGQQLTIPFEEDA